MELTRRAGQGRLSEIFGERTFTTDVFLRTLDLYGHAERSLAALPPEARKTLEAYARGVNAFIDRKTGWLEPRLPPEFLLLRHAPEPWQPADSLVDRQDDGAATLSTNLNHEMSRLASPRKGLAPAEIEDLMPPTMRRLAAAAARAGRSSIRCSGQAGRASRRPLAPVDELIGGGASNNWVVSGSRTRSGKPLLANDPHLRLDGARRSGISPTWRSSSRGRHRSTSAGATLAGMPLIVLGRTDTLAWGFTNTGPDVQDIFIEKINPDNREQYLTPEGWRAVRDRADGDRRQGRRRAHRGAPAHAARARAAGLLPQSRGMLGAWLRGGAAVDGAQRRRHDHRRRHVRPRHPRRRATTWSACASTSCRCRAWWWPTRTATSA